jgi:hypothetical protein
VQLHLRRRWKSLTGARHARGQGSRRCSSSGSGQTGHQLLPAPLPPPRIRCAGHTFPEGRRACVSGDVFRLRTRPRTPAGARGYIYLIAGYSINGYRGARAARARAAAAGPPAIIIALRRLNATFWDCLSLNSQPPPQGTRLGWPGDARRPRPWLAPGMWHPRIPLSSRMSRAARAASPVRDPPGAALTWVRQCLAAWEGRERPYQGASGRQPALSSGGGGPFADTKARPVPPHPCARRKRAEPPA